MRKREKEGRRILADWIRSKCAPEGREGEKEKNFISIFKEENEKFEWHFSNFPEILLAKNINGRDRSYSRTDSVPVHGY